MRRPIGIHMRRVARCMVPAIALALVLPIAGWAQDHPPSQVELNGYQLGQYDLVLKSTFGEPDEVSNHDDGWVDRLYYLDDEARNYMIFGFVSKDERQMISIQVTGEPFPEMVPFLGLRLGDSRGRVLKVLGQPTSSGPVPDMELEFLEYEGRNYSVEIDAKDKLSSIKVIGYEGFDEHWENPVADINPFKNCIVQEDVECLLSILAPDMEIYKGDEAFSYQKAARAELSDPDSRIRRFLLGGEGSVHQVFKDERLDGEVSVRVRKSGPSGAVYKFYESKILEEIAYVFFAGEWRVWEIRFR